jgi:DNA-binding CsgD family transcriptional regulator
MSKNNHSTPPQPSSETATVAQGIAQLVDGIGEPTMGKVVLEFLRAQSLFDSALVLMYRLKHRPTVLIDALDHSMRSNDVDSYTAGAYLLDPMRKHALTLRAAEVVRLSDITDEDFRSGEYFQTDYAASHLSDEVNFLIPVAPEQVIAVCLERSQSLTPFADAEVERFRDWLPMFSAVLKRHVVALEHRTETATPRVADREHDRLEARLTKFGTDALTPHEHEVVQHLLNGASAPDIAGRLSLSLQTVRVHRRNIYEKLEVSSLGQLFSLAMHALLGERV